MAPIGDFPGQQRKLATLETYQMASNQDLYVAQSRIADSLHTIQQTFTTEMSKIEQEQRKAIATAEKQSADAISTAQRVRDTAIRSATQIRDTAVADAGHKRDTAIRGAKQKHDTAIADAGRKRDTAINNAPQISVGYDIDRLHGRIISATEGGDRSALRGDITYELSKFGEFEPRILKGIEYRLGLRRNDPFDDFFSMIGGSLVGGLVVGGILWLYITGSSGDGASLWWIGVPLGLAITVPVLLIAAGSQRQRDGLSRNSAEIKQTIESAVSSATNTSTRAKAQYQRIHDQANAQYTQSAGQANAQYTQSIDQANAQYTQNADQANAQYNTSITQAEANYTQSTTLANEQYRSRRAHCEAQHRQSIETISPQLDAYIAKARSEILRFEETVDPEWIPSTAVARHTELGRIDVIANTDRAMPVVVRMPDQMSLLFHSRGAQQSHIAESLLLRYLTSFPAGKLEFTLIDPVGLGRNVASLMHLHDHRPQLINDRAWVEPQHIEKQLAELSETMQNIIQKYLKTTYTTMAEYNEAAGEVEEPYRVLVVNNFPANFTSEALRHLVSIIQNGPKCGVHTVIAVDDSQELPYKFNMADLEAGCTVFRQIGSGQAAFTMDAPGVRWWPFFPEEMPSTEVTQHILDVVGKEAVGNSVVKVPFSRLAPAQEAWWASSSRDGIAAPLGVTGARKPQMLSIGQNMANTALVVGRVGSGKSTLMHAAIMNLALTYSPEELEIYLLDFKKGVEFKTYAVHKLPHARAIAVESEREFAMSVLQKLDRELTDRGELFRGVTESHGEAPNIQSYRGKTGRTLPRILLIVDEFQEFFTESDALANQAGLLLDRLVRQGRAFGIHVMLGTQTLAGSYGMAKSTLNQIPIRIALQCSDADSRLILADDNPAARLLNRPGEAIYNDENGRIEGNNRFQTAWLTDDERDAYLDQLAAMAETQFPDLPEPVVFEGNATADPARNRQLATILHATTTSAKKPVVNAWVGDPIAITDPAAAPLRDQAGANLLVIGQDEEASYGVLATAVIGIARQHELIDDKATITVVDMSAADHPHAELFREIGEIFPDRITVAGRRQAIPVVEHTYQELERRMAADDGGATSFDRMYVVIVGLPRARDLREEEDRSFSGGFFGEEPPTKTSNQMLHTILKEGPDFGIHVIAWADTLSNLSRIVDRRGLREFDPRVTMQMSADDSNALVDSQAASKLGPNRALLYSEEKGTALKFRPYGVPSQAWLDQVRQRPIVN